MATQLFVVGNAFAAIALMGWAFVSLLTGSAIATGATFRALLDPSLTSIRSNSVLSREELSDRTMLAAVTAAILGGLLSGSVLLMIVGAMLFTARPKLGRLMTEENRLRALIGSFSIDMAVGLYLPIILAQVLLANYASALVFFLVILSLSWPPGGAGVRRGVWQPAWQG